MFFSKEADSFLNAVDRSKGRSHFAEGGDVDDHKRGKRVHRAEGDEAREEHRRGRRVGRADGDDVKAEEHRRGKRVHARSHHSDVAEVEPHAKGHSVGRKHRDQGGLLPLISNMRCGKRVHGRSRRAGGGDGKADGGDVKEDHHRGKRVKRSFGGDMLGAFVDDLI